MTCNYTVEYYVQPRHIYSHSRICTHRFSCSIPSILVEFHVFYLLDHASVHGISTLVIWFQCISNIFNYYGDLDPLYIFIMKILIYYILYVAMTTHVTFCISCLFMAIVLLCIRDFYMYLQSYAEIDYCTILMDGWFFYLVLHRSTSGMDL